MWRGRGKIRRGRVLGRDLEATIPKVLDHGHWGGGKQGDSVRLKGGRFLEVKESLGRLRVLLRRHLRQPLPVSSRTVSVDTRDLTSKRVITNIRVYKGK